eukprot:2022103-Pleurochrysis_carterae.AAC.2
MLLLPCVHLGRPSSRRRLLPSHNSALTQIRPFHFLACASTTPERGRFLIFTISCESRRQCKAPCIELCTLDDAFRIPAICARVLQEC